MFSIGFWWFESCQVEKTQAPSTPLQHASQLPADSTNNGSQKAAATMNSGQQLMESQVDHSSGTATKIKSEANLPSVKSEATVKTEPAEPARAQGKVRVPKVKSEPCDQAKGKPNPSTKIRTQIEEYASQVRKDGGWLDVADAQLLTEYYGKSLALLCDLENDFMPVTAARVLASRLPAGFHFEDMDPLDRSCPSQWCLLSCNALYDPKGRSNHWMPAFFKEQVDKDVWSSLTAEARVQTNSEMASVQRQMRGLLAMETIDDELIETQRQDLEMKLKQSLRNISLIFVICFIFLNVLLFYNVLYCFIMFYIFFVLATLCPGFATFQIFGRGARKLELLSSKCLQMATALLGAWGACVWDLDLVVCAVARKQRDSSGKCETYLRRSGSMCHMNPVGRRFTNSLWKR